MVYFNKGRASFINQSFLIMKQLHMISFILLVIGGLNWLFLALFSWDISQLFGGMNEVISKVIYILVGLAAINELLIHKGLCKECDKGRK